MMKKTRKKVEIMTAMLKGLGNDGNDEGTWEFCNSDIPKQAKRICNSSDDQSHSYIFLILRKEPMKRFFFIQILFSEMRVN